MSHAAAVNTVEGESDVRGTAPLLGPAIRRSVLEIQARPNVGHIGSALSIADMVGAVFTAIGAPDPSHSDRDRFVLSKGHAALALYAALVEVGILPRQELSTFCADNSLLGVHPEHPLAGVEFSTGSLGQGLSFAVGAALAASIQHSARRIIAIVSDAECNEGVIWEAAMFAGHHRPAKPHGHHRPQPSASIRRTPLTSWPSEDMAARWRSFRLGRHNDGRT